jgi:hypothetical protein
MRLYKKGQGATEYLLMLSAVMVVVAVAVWYIMGMAPAAFISGIATLAPGDNVVFTPDARMVPNPIPAPDWRYLILDENKIAKGVWATDPHELRIGDPNVIDPVPVVVRGDFLRIQYRLDEFWDFKVK